MPPDDVIQITTPLVSLTVTAPVQVITVAEPIAMAVTAGTPAEATQVVERGLPGRDGPPGPAGGTGYVHTQSQPVQLWSVTHLLGRFPSVTIVDTTRAEVIADVTYVDANHLTISFGAPSSGMAYLN